MSGYLLYTLRRLTVVQYTIQDCNKSVLSSSEAEVSHRQQVLRYRRDEMLDNLMYVAKHLVPLVLE